MRLTIKEVRLDDATAAALTEYADRRGVKLATAVGYLVKSGLLRLAALKKYRESPRGRRANRRRR